MDFQPSLFKKPKGGRNLGSLCGGSHCGLYSTRERGEGGANVLL